MTENRTVLDNVLSWLHDGYPEGVPPKDYFPLLALLKRSLTEEEVVKAAQTVLKGTNSDTVTEAEIRAAVHAVTARGTESRRVASGRLAAGLCRLAAGGARPLTLLAVVAPERMVLGDLHKDQ